MNAVTLAVEHLHPDVGSVIELGGQDAKIIMFKDGKGRALGADGERAGTGAKTAVASMNDKCASGTGATIDKCFVKVGAPPELVTSLHFDDSKLHHVAAKCGVFAETDIVNLIKSGIPATEALCSLADAIVLQNLLGSDARSPPSSTASCSSAARTRTCRSCRKRRSWRIPQTWKERGYDYPKDIPLEELIFVPKNSAVLRRRWARCSTAFTRRKT